MKSKTACSTLLISIFCALLLAPGPLLAMNFAPTDDTPILLARGGGSGGAGGAKSAPSYGGQAADDGSGKTLSNQEQVHERDRERVHQETDADRDRDMDKKKDMDKDRDRERDRTHQ